MKTKLFVCVGLVVAFGAWADTFTWKGTSGGSWNDAANWEENAVPDASGAEVDFSAASGTYAVSVASAVTVNLDAAGATAAFSTTLLSSDGGLAGDVSGWTLDAALPANGSWRVALHKSGGRVVLMAAPSGTCIIFR